MFFRATTRRRGDKVYQSLHLVESYRSQEGKVRQRILVKFGAVHKYPPDQVEEIIQGLKKFFHLEVPAPEVNGQANLESFPWPEGFLLDDDFSVRQ